MKIKEFTAKKRLKPFFCIAKLREMVTFGPVNSKVCVAYSRCPYYGGVQNV